MFCQTSKQWVSSSNLDRRTIFLKVSNIIFTFPEWTFTLLGLFPRFRDNVGFAAKGKGKTPGNLALAGKWWE